MTGNDAKGSWRRIILRAVLLTCVSAAVGLAVNVGHVVKYFRGEYRLVFAEAAASEDPPLITLPEAADLFAVGRAVFIDARTPEEYEAGHIAGAKNVPLYDPGSDMIWESLAVSQEADVVVYCSGDLCQDSLILARRISRLGWRNLRVYVGGWAEWNAAGLPVEWGR
ncbi:MAG: hypothetical protein JW747_09905 [Candidatus Aminicenantes bacterium]|nr:hypothetical protein [Candidatus Aminicenantes bacterium]